MKSAILFLALAASLPAGATDYPHDRYVQSSASAVCDSPWANNTLRKRPLGVSNYGDRVEFVTCAWESLAGNGGVEQVGIVIANDRPDHVAATCTLVQGVRDVGATYTVQTNAIWSGHSFPFIFDIENDSGLPVSMSCEVQPGTEITFTWIKRAN